MPAGRLANRNLLQNVTQPVYINNTNMGIIISVNICNRNTTAITFSLAISTMPAPDEVDYIEFGTPVIGNAQFDRTEIFLGPGEYVVAIASANNVGITIMGIGFGMESETPVLITDTVADGSSQLRAATSAAAIKALTGTNTDGVYWIKPSPSAPAQEVYCVMDSTWDGGGWMIVANNAAVDNVYQSTHQPRLTSRNEYVGSSGADSYSRTNNFSINVTDFAITKLAWCARQPLGTFKDIYTYVYGTFNTATYIPATTAWSRKFDNYHLNLPWLVVPDVRTRPAYATAPTNDTDSFSFITLNDGRAGYGDFSAAYPYSPVTTLGKNASNPSYIPISNDNNVEGINGTFSWADRSLAGSEGANSIKGWDDFQDGNSLGDAWGTATTPNYGRGYPSFIMVK